MRIPDQLVEQTRQRCAADPLAAQTCEALARIERELHRRGWDVPAQVWRLDYADADHRSVRYDKSFAFTPLLLELQDYAQGNMSVALGVMGDWVELGAGTSQYSGDMPAWFSTRGKALAAVSGHTLHGYVLSSEAWAANLGSDAPPELIDRVKRATSERRLYQLPERIEMRTVSAVCRDGSVWTYCRIRGEDPRAWLSLPGDKTYSLGGGVVRGLARLVIAQVPDHRIDLGPETDLDAALDAFFRVTEPGGPSQGRSREGRP